MSEKRNKHVDAAIVPDSADVNRALELASKREGERRDEILEGGHKVEESFLAKPECKR